jgi:hypothetical protein
MGCLDLYLTAFLMFSFVFIRVHSWIERILDRLDKMWGRCLGGMNSGCGNDGPRRRGAGMGTLGEVTVVLRLGGYASNSNSAISQ